MLTIATYPNPALRTAASPVKSVGREERLLLDEMLDTMYRSEGIGLAAPQVSISQRLIVIDCGDGRIYKLANPEIVLSKEAEYHEEGCLSLPGVTVSVRRARTVSLKALDEHGRPVEFETSDLLAQTIQHEVDHLNGITIVDYLDPLRRFMRVKNMKR